MHLQNLSFITRDRKLIIVSLFVISCILSIEIVFNYFDVHKFPSEHNNICFHSLYNNYKQQIIYIYIYIYSSNQCSI